MALVAAVVLAMIGNSWTTNAAPNNRDGATVAEETVAGPSWTFSVRSVDGHIFEAVTLEGSVSLDRG